MTNVANAEKPMMNEAALMRQNRTSANSLIGSIGALLPSSAATKAAQRAGDQRQRRAGGPQPDDPRPQPRLGKAVPEDRERARHQRRRGYPLHDPPGDEHRVARGDRADPRSGGEAGAFDVADVDVTALLLFSALHGGFDEFAHVGPEVAKQRLLPPLLALFRRTVAAPPP